MIWQLWWKILITPRGGLKEGAEWENLLGYLIELLSGWTGLECEMVIDISAACHLGLYKVSQKYPGDVIVKFPPWSITSKIFEVITGPNLSIEGSTISAQ